MKEATITRLKRAMAAFQGYDDPKKKEFELAGKAFFREWLAEHKIEGKITYNKAGIAVAGDVRCFGTGWEAEICHGTSYNLPPIMFRSRDPNYGTDRKKGQTTRTGTNQWFTFEKFAGLTPDQLLHTWVS
jgi:hypothetical protein